LTGELLHPPNRRELRHVFPQHVEIFEQQRALVFQRRLKRLPSVHRIFDLPKDPWIGHRAAADQDSVASRFAQSIERLLDRRDVAAT